MDKEKDELEITQILVKYNCNPKGCGDCEWSPERGDCDDYAPYRNIAKDIVKAGYGNIKEAFDELLAEIDIRLTPRGMISYERVALLIKNLLEKRDKDE